MKKLVAITMAAIMGIGLFSLVGCGKHEKKISKDIVIHYDPNELLSYQKGASLEEIKRVSKMNVAITKKFIDAHEEAINALNLEDAFMFLKAFMYEEKEFPKFSEHAKYCSGKTLRERTTVMKNKHGVEFGEYLTKLQNTVLKGKTDFDDLDESVRQKYMKQICSHVTIYFAASRAAE